MKSVLEVNQKCVDKTDNFTVENSQGELCGISICPPTSEDYWTFRVKLYKDQAVLGFPKYGLVGVGMALEEDGNTNLPLHSTESSQENAERIADHISGNKKYKFITRQMIVDAIVIINNAARKLGYVE